MDITIGLSLHGEDDAPLWKSTVSSSASGQDLRNCCERGHHTPEAAAQHGGEIAAARLAQWARSLKPPTAGAAALAVAGV